ncbi:MAG: hypothetical protein ACKO6K_03780 [Chitinophagaceae bacterium]
MKDYLETSVQYYWMDIVMFFSSLICLFICFIHRQKHKELKYIFLYPLTSFLVQGLLFILYGLLHYDNYPDGHTYLPLEVIAEKFFLLTEFGCLSYYYYQIFTSTVLKRINLGITFGYGIVLLVFILRKHFFWEYTFPLYYVQAFSLVALSVLGVLEIFHTDPMINLSDLPAFWIISGSLLYFSCTLPLYVAQDFIFRSDGTVLEKNLYAINYLSYALFFLLISKGILCKRVAKP